MEKALPSGSVSFDKLFARDLVSERPMGGLVEGEGGRGGEEDLGYGIDEMDFERGPGDGVGVGSKELSADVVFRIAGDSTRTKFPGSGLGGTDNDLSPSSGAARVLGGGFMPSLPYNSVQNTTSLWFGMRTPMSPYPPPSFLCKGSSSEGS